MWKTWDFQLNNLIKNLYASLIIQNESAKTDVQGIPEDMDYVQWGFTNEDRHVVWIPSASYLMDLRRTIA